MKLSDIRISHTAIGDRIVLARFGKNDKQNPLETKDAMSDFLGCLLSYGFDGKVPLPGEGCEFDFNGGDAHFDVTIKRREA